MGRRVQCFSDNQSSFFVGEEHVPVVPEEARVLGAGATSRAGVAVGTTVLHVAATDRIWSRTAAPRCSRRPAARLHVPASDLCIALDVSVARRAGSGSLLQHIHRCQRDGLHLQHDEPLTRLGDDVAAEALRAAVLLIRAAHGILQWAAAPLAREEAAAGGAFRTLV